MSSAVSGAVCSCSVMVVRGHASTCLSATSVLFSAAGRCSYTVEPLGYAVLFGVSSLQDQGSFSLDERRLSVHIVYAKPCSPWCDFEGLGRHPPFLFIRTPPTLPPSPSLP
ncbi:hypothetical protein L226DRAFT_52238 [Lentinus tigrinus ALCF2SS1-7]|uniref:uncharacterized protein n=1 Tax=Lentinus tigrinus ALCF2SS1-7 TaxID=1328758 RepID=UPI0011663E6C|nr:hypothetical protein L226DRAFT_52238 [Lentinus tigrinus ALCF2SS1-7]